MAGSAGRGKKKKGCCLLKAAVAGGALLFYGIVLVAAFLVVLVNLTGGNAIVTVPDLVGQPRGAAEAALPSGLFLKVIDQSCTLPAGTIIAQDLPPGKTVKVPHYLEVTVSRGEEARPVPDLLNMPLEIAAEILAKQGLKIGNINEVEESADQVSEVLAGAILRTDPAAGTMVAVGSKVDLFVKKVIQTGGITVPDLTGRTLGEAQPLLESLGLTLGRHTTTEDFNHLPGTILTQTPPAGAEVTSGTVVSFTVADQPGDRAGASRSVQFYFVTPPGIGTYEVKVVVSDNQSDREVFRETCEPGRHLLLPIRVSGRAYAYVYVGGELYRVMPLE